MAAEIICVGTELLLGEILNSNSQYLAQELARLGIPHYFQTVVGDNPERIKQAIAIAQKRAQILIFTGGLGPTPDDLTTETIADFFQTTLRENTAVIADIEAKFAQTGRPMAANNRKQALLPEGAEVLANATGTAPGMIWHPQTDLLILTFPGVPSEMRQMWQGVAVPYLQSQGWGKTSIYSRVLRFRGIGESALAEKVTDFFNLTNPTVAPYAGKGEVRLRVSCAASSEALAWEIIDPVVEQIKAIAGLDYFGQDEDTIASVVGELLRQRRETVAVAESCTGGGLGALLTDQPGSSDYFWGGVIAYDNQVKIKLLGVDPEIIEYCGAVSEAAAEAMALGVKERLGTDWGIAITGIAGPGGGTAEKPVGTVYVGLADPHGQASHILLQFGDRRGREWIRYLSACQALDHLRRRLQSS
ncbi:MULTISPECIES: competence/damage-inducible protein A [unclassified Synechocystis]|uniref:competence/damage-inducible protein A n=1 Tax=unclassified Synechocystis TaxID=2640012 RepID=UPI000404B8A3|nr:MULTISPECIES: competence/damage-inducible protein A [unclassified Synechocystis]AIE73251.1 Molybdopterin binding motif, CinA N-terminal domain / C-terminal domain of CinA type S [Synechocystis sp. PCC 6714]MCT0253080.1 competence/damage-inducible protein A [Synechocystis sp. CS-94]